MKFNQESLASPSDKYLGSSPASSSFTGSASPSSDLVSSRSSSSICLSSSSASFGSTDFATSISVGDFERLRLRLFDFDLDRLIDLDFDLDLERRLERDRLFDILPDSERLFGEAEGVTEGALPFS